MTSDKKDDNLGESEQHHQHPTIPPLRPIISEDKATFPVETQESHGIRDMLCSYLHRWKHLTYDGSSDVIAKIVQHVGYKGP